MTSSQPIGGTAIPDLMCRLDFVSFVRRCFRTLSPSSEFLPNWHIEALAFQLERVRLGEITRLNVNCPRRMLKSIISAVAFPAFVLGHDPSKRIIVISYGTELATKLANDFRAVINSAWYRQIFPHTQISPSKNTEYEVVTTQNGSRLAVSIDGSLTGRGGDIVILDDPLKAMDARSDSKRERVNETFRGTILNCLDNKLTGAIILVMQRLHPYDLSGRALESDEWTSLAFPAIAERQETIQIGRDRYHLRQPGDVLHPQREPREIIARYRAQMSAEDFAAQYQQTPILPGGTMFERKWIVRYQQLPTPSSSDCIVQSWDTAAKEGELNDYSACCTLLHHDQKIYVMDVVRERLAFPALRERAIALHRTYQPRVILVEDTGVGTALVAELKNAGLPVTAVKPMLSKQIRASVQTQKFASHKVWLPIQATWLTDFEDELFAFPYSPHDDQVDSLCQALAHETQGHDLVGLCRGLEQMTSMMVLDSMFRGRII